MKAFATTSATFIAWLGVVATATSASAGSSFTIQGHLDELPETGKEWVTIAGGNNEAPVEFLPAGDFDWSDLDLDFTPSKDGPRNNNNNNPSIRQRNLKKKQQEGYLSGYSNIFVDGSGHYYNDYSQAWRLLGFYIDCNAPFNNDNECYDEEEGSGDEDTPACQRYLLWAAYVDLDYAGGGIGEYQFYDRHEKKWDKTACVAGSGRCAKMDCHLKDTNFRLLGFFKEPNYHEWMEQLFKHQGVCLWTDNEYSFMSTDRYLWPCYCTSTGQMDEDGNTLYYDTKPMPEGRIGIGLYTDSRCKYDYLPSLDQSVDALAILEKGGGDKNDYGSVAQLKKGLEQWNDAFDVFKICQPCKAYNLGYNKDVNKGDRKGGDRDNNDDAGGLFSCYDDADYVNVNQCMKFKTKTEMLAADFRDLMMANEQGNIVEFEVMGKTYGYGGFRSSTGSMIREHYNLVAIKSTIPTETIIFFSLSLSFFILSIVIFAHLYRQRRRRASSWNLNAPLMGTTA